MRFVSYALFGLVVTAFVVLVPCFYSWNDLLCGHTSFFSWETLLVWAVSTVLLICFFSGVPSLAELRDDYKE